MSCLVNFTHCKYPLPLIQAAQNQSQTNTGRLAKFLKLKICAKVLLTVNIDIQDRLINGQTRIIKHKTFVQSSAREVYVKFSDEQAGSKVMTSSYLSRQNCRFPIEKVKLQLL